MGTLTKTYDDLHEWVLSAPEQATDSKVVVREVALHGLIKYVARYGLEHYFAERTPGAKADRYKDMLEAVCDEIDRRFQVLETSPTRRTGGILGE